jgi:N utilization substance protein B
LDSAALAILRLAVYEIAFMEEIPNAVSINEAIELAKVYGDDDSPAFINGLLGEVAKRLENQ